MKKLIFAFSLILLISKMGYFNAYACDFCDNTIKTVVRDSEFTIYYEKKHIPPVIISFLRELPVVFMDAEEYIFPDAQLRSNKLFYVAIYKNYYIIVIVSWLNYTYLAIELSDNQIENACQGYYEGGMRNFAVLKRVMLNSEIPKFLCIKDELIRKFNHDYAKGMIKIEKEDPLKKYDYLDLTKLDSVRLLNPINKEEAVKKDSLYGDYIPKNLLDCFKTMDTIFNDYSKNNIRNLRKMGPLSLYHGIIATDWGLHIGSRLKQYFIEKGVSSSYEMSFIIIDFYKEYLEGKHEAWQEFDKKKN